MLPSRTASRPDLRLRTRAPGHAQESRSGLAAASQAQHAQHDSRGDRHHVARSVSVLERPQLSPVTWLDNRPPDHELLTLSTGLSDSTNLLGRPGRTGPDLVRHCVWRRERLRRPRHPRLHQRVESGDPLPQAEPVKYSPTRTERSGSGRGAAVSIGCSRLTGASSASIPSPRPSTSRPCSKTTLAESGSVPAATG